nr:hypothetical protein [uncultured Rhodopila sp.]
MTKPRTRAKARPSETPAFAKTEDLDVLEMRRRRRAALEKQYRESCAAFTGWETARMRTDLRLYCAIGRLAEFAAAVGNDHQVLTDFAAEKGVRATKASSLYTVIAKLVVTTDRRKASKYAAVLHLAARQGIEPTAEVVVAFIQAEGGTEACLKRLRGQPRETGAPTRRGRPSAFSRAVARLAGVGRSQAPTDLQRPDLPQDYVLIVGVRGDDGILQLLHEPVTEEGWYTRRSPRWRRKRRGRAGCHNLRLSGNAHGRVRGLVIDARVTTAASLPLARNQCGEEPGDARTPDHAADTIHACLNPGPRTWLAYMPLRRDGGRGPVTRPAAREGRHRARFASRPSGC